MPPKLADPKRKRGSTTQESQSAAPAKKPRAAAARRSRTAPADSPDPAPAQEDGAAAHPLWKFFRPSGSWVTCPNDASAVFEKALYGASVERQLSCPASLPLGPDGALVRVWADTLNQRAYTDKGQHGDPVPLFRHAWSAAPKSPDSQIFDLNAGIAFAEPYVAALEGHWANHAAGEFRIPRLFIPDPSEGPVRAVSLKRIKTERERRDPALWAAHSTGWKDYSPAGEDGSGGMAWVRPAREGTYEVSARLEAAGDRKIGLLHFYGYPDQP